MGVLLVQKRDVFVLRVVKTAFYCISCKNGGKNSIESVLADRMNKLSGCVAKRVSGGQARVVLRWLVD